LNTPTFHAVIGAMLLALGSAQAAGVEKSARPWLFELGFGASDQPDYSGSQGSSPRLLLWANGEYATENWGRFALDSAPLTLDPQFRWEFIDSREYGLGLLLGYRKGRNDRSPGWVGDTGSARLKGMGNVSPAVDGGLSGFVQILGIPLFAQLRAALNGDQGTIGVLGAYLPLELTSRFELTVLPSLTWANGKQMQAFYGVTPAQSAASGFKVYDPGSGWQNAALELLGDWNVGGPWHLIGAVGYQRLLGKAADSPLTQDKNQWSGLLGLSYRF
jgi:outer membrane protein